MDKIKFIFDTAIEAGFTNEELLGKRFDEILDKDEDTVELIFEIAKKWKS